MISLTCCIAVTAANPKPQIAAPAAIDRYMPAPMAQSPAPNTTHAMKTADVVKVSPSLNDARCAEVSDERHHPEQREYGCNFLSASRCVSSISKGAANAMTTYWPVASKVVIR